jgi:hypothetical protein
MFMGTARYKRVKHLAVEHGPAGITATPTEPKHLGTRLHRWNHAKSASSHDPPPAMLLQLANVRHHKGVATAEWLLSNRGRLLTSAASAHFLLFSMFSEWRSKERRHVVEALTFRDCQCLTAVECQPESVTDTSGQNELRRRDTAG